MSTLVLYNIDLSAVVSVSVSCGC